MKACKYGMVWHGMAWEVRLSDGVKTWGGLLWLWLALAFLFFFLFLLLLFFASTGRTGPG